MTRRADIGEAVVRRAIMRVIEPLFDRGFADQSFANRAGRGAHRAAALYQRYAAEAGQVLRRAFRPIRRKLGAVYRVDAVEKPKGMHWSTFYALLDRDADTQAALWRFAAQSLSRR